MVNGHWGNHEPIFCDPSGTRYAEMDQDKDRYGNVTGWQVGDEDWLWQDVQAADLHSLVSLSVTEAHHMKSGTAEITLYGSLDGAIWLVIYHRPGVESPYGTGKCIADMPPEYFTYEIVASFPFYRLEIHGRMNEEGDGFLFGNFDLHVEP